MNNVNFYNKRNVFLLVYDLISKIMLTQYLVLMKGLCLCSMGNFEPFSFHCLILRVHLLLLLLLLYESVQAFL